MKRLILVRHGKSSWKYDVQDSQRPLKKRAYRDADKVINAFEPSLKLPLTIWCSYADRALQTASIFKEQLEVPDQDFFIRKDLYTFDNEKLLEIISSCDDSIDQLMVFGHNPAITEVVNEIGNQFFNNVPTTGLVFIQFESDSWRELKKGSTLLFLFPKNF